MTICFFGTYISDYPRIQVLKRAFGENNIRIVECHTRKSGVGKFIELWKQHQRFKGEYDIMLVGMGGYTLVWFAKLLSRKPVVFDAFVSQYLTNVEDRKKCSPGSLQAMYYSWLDKNSCRLADLVLLDTNAQIDYFVRRYHPPKEKFVRVFESTNDEVFFPNSRSAFRVPRSEKFVIHWHGYIVPFHGLEVIVRAAKELQRYPDIEFRLITRFDSKYDTIKRLVESEKLANVKFSPETSYEGLASTINEADVCLGVFGNNPKAWVVIPNKIFEATACGKPVITARHKVIEELFTDGQDIILCNPGDFSDLAQKILELYHDEVKRKRLGENARKLFLGTLTSREIGKNLYQVLLKVMKS